LSAALAQLADDAPGALLFVIVGRSDVMSDGPWRLPDLEALPVVPLDDAASERLLRAYLGGAELDPPTRTVLIERAQGNPFFLAELLHLLVDRGLLRRMGDGWRLTGELPEEMLPAGVQAVLAARIDDLDPAAKTVLRDASVIGNRFTVDMLHALDASSTLEDIAASLRELTARGIVRPADDDESITRTYLFAHALARDVAYAGISKAERARRHARVALWARTDLAWASGETDALIAVQAERAVALAREMSLPDTDPSWEARSAGFGALGRLGESALARDTSAMLLRSSGCIDSPRRRRRSPSCSRRPTYAVGRAHSSSLVTSVAAKVIFTRRHRPSCRRWRRRATRVSTGWRGRRCGSWG
jgi:hypothetical protein